MSKTTQMRPIKISISAHAQTRKKNKKPIRIAGFSPKLEGTAF